MSERTGPPELLHALRLEDRLRAGEEADEAEATLRKSLGLPPEPTEAQRRADALATAIRQAEGRMAEAENDEAARAAVREVLVAFFGRVDVAPLADVDRTLPPAVIWRDDGQTDPSKVDPLLSVGEVALLSGAGGLGKSSLALELADAAGGWQSGVSSAVCGLRVTGGGALVVSYEDSPARLAQRVGWFPRTGWPPEAIVSAQKHLYVWRNPEPLWIAAAERGGDSRAASSWRDLWERIRAANCRLVVIDPASAALADVSTSETGPVRAFLRALTREAQPAGDWQGCGVLIVTHDTKAGRDAAAQGQNPGAQAVGGSAAWFDGARGVLALERSRSGAILLLCAKANYAPSGWALELRERFEGPRYRGLELVGPLHRDAVEVWRRRNRDRIGPAQEEANDV